MLYCVECGCCSELGRGWVATRCDDPDPDIALYCPPCAAAEFGFRPDVAANYVCAWEPLPLDRRHLEGPYPALIPRWAGPTIPPQCIRARDDTPPGPEQLRAVLLREHVGRVRDGLV